MTIEKRALDRLAALLLEKAGLKIAPDGYHGLRLALSARLPASGLDDAEEYVRRLKEPAGENELRALLPHVTVGYTEFFRDAKQFAALEKKLLPQMLRVSRKDRRKISIWSAGCATGEEPYSLAMLLSELGATTLDASIWATDLNPAAVQAAIEGKFPARRIQGLSEQRRKKFFRDAEPGFEVNPKLREFIRFEGQNLAVPVFSKVAPESLDLILCRNVIIYFDLPTIRALMDRFWRGLRPGGYLLLGYSESLFKVYEKFEMVEVEGAFLYRRGTGKPVAKPRPAIPKSVPTLRHSQKRWEASPVSVEKPTSTPEIQSPRPSPPRSPVARLDHAVAKMNNGDFEGAMSEVQKLVDEEQDLDAILTLGNLHSLMGNAEEARNAFARATAREPLCVEARVFGGVSAIQAGQLVEARAELSKALFLEPTLALAHYLLAQVEEKMERHDEARRCYRNAITQLRFPQRALAGHYPDLPDSPDFIGRAAKYALAALEELSA